MADLRARDKFEKNEDEFAKWAVGWGIADDVIYGIARLEYVKLRECKICDSNIGHEEYLKGLDVEEHRVG